MTTSNVITYEYLQRYLSLDKEIEKLEIAPTATGGRGINNLAEFPPPVPLTKIHKGTEYSKHFIEQDKQQEQALFRQTIDLPGGTSITINNLEDIDELSTLPDDASDANELHAETTRQIYSTYYQNHNRKYNPDLVITHYREQILDLLNFNPVVVIQGPTGCGKTTQVPQYILDHYVSKGTYCNIIVTQPRKIAAISIARRICHERKWQMGTIIGYQVAMDNKTSPDTRLAYVTTGVLLQKLVNNRTMEDYTHVIIDEVHERDQETDFALLVVKKLLKTNSRRVKVILMSATIDTSLFAKYFSILSKGEPAPIIEIVGKSKEVTEHYVTELKALSNIQLPDFDPLVPIVHNSLYDVVVNLLFVFDKIEKSEQGISPSEDYAPCRGAVLIFLPGYEEICQMSNKLKIAALNRKFWILPLHSTITIEEQTKVFLSPPPQHRKIIISTNIAESSITVPDIKYVIDFCLTKSLVCDPDTNYTCLQLEWASKSNCAQRKGRAGRVDIGRVYRMVPHDFYEKYLPEYNVPEMQRCPLTQTILFCKKLNFGEPQALLALALEPPNLSDIENAILELQEALALAFDKVNSMSGDLTYIGHVMASLPLDVKISKLIIFGYIFNCLEDCIIIASSLSLKSFFAKPFGKKLEAYASRTAWANGTFSDCLAYLNAFKNWKNLSMQNAFKRPGGMSEFSWGDKNFIQIKRIKEVDLLVKEIKNRLKDLNIVVSYNRHDHDANEILILKVVIAAAFFPYYYFPQPLNEEEILKQTNDNDPHNTVVLIGLPPDQGLLYACDIRDMLAFCGKNLHIEFEGRKAYIQFNKDQQTEDNKMHSSVYLAVKMRQLRKPFELNLFNDSEAQNKIEQLRKLKQSAENKNYLGSNRVTVNLDDTNVKRAVLPSLQVSILPVVVTHVVNPSCFYVRRTDPQTNNICKFLDTTINCLKGKNLQQLRDKPQVNMLVLALFKEYGREPLYYRAQIKEVNGNKVNVFFIDYGNISELNISDLREIDPNTTDVINTPPLAFECQLCNIKPEPITGCWSTQAKQWFNREVTGHLLTAKLYSIVQDKVRIELLHVKHDGTTISYNDLLKSKGFAVHAEESYASKHNHELRKSSNTYDATNAIFVAEHTPYAYSLDETIPFRNIKPTNKKVHLKGPSNPLEVNFQGITYLDRSKSVKVEFDSVNSVSFNSEPQDKCSSMLVASYVSLHQHSNNLCARSTTLMPNIPGLPIFICLLFSPYSELRCDKNRNSYIGTLCGLGYNENTGESLYPEHDIELPFDVEFDYDDLNEINSIRMGINIILGSQNDAKSWNHNSIKKFHENVRRVLIKLLKKKRQYKEPEYFTKSYSWQQVPSEFILKPSLDGTPADCPHVFPLLNGINLSTISSLQVELKIHNEELYNLATGQRKPFDEPVACRLCSKTLNSPFELAMHLDTTSHKQKEKLLSN